MLPLLKGTAPVAADPAGRSPPDPILTGQWAKRIINYPQRAMAQTTTPNFKRFHIRTNGRRTTISLDFFLAELLAVKLGAATTTPQAHRRVRVWLQSQTDEFAGSRDLNRYLMRRGILAITDNILSTRFAAVGIKEIREEPSGPLPPPKATEGRRFVLFRAANSSAFPPDVLAWGTSVEDVRGRAKEIFAEDDALQKVVRAEYITTLKEKPKGFYVRQCSEECWKLIQRSKKNRREVQPVIDSEGIWRTRKEIAEWRKTHLWETVFKPALERKALKTISTIRIRSR
jgi:hypothetical protein